MSFRDEVLAAKPKPAPVKTESELAMEEALRCSEVIKKDILSKAKYTKGPFRYLALCVLEHNDIHTTSKKGFLSDSLKEIKTEYIISKYFLLFHDYLKSILDNDGITIGDWEVNRYSLGDYDSILCHIEDIQNKPIAANINNIDLRNNISNCNYFQPEINIRLNPNVPLERHLSNLSSPNHRTRLSQNGNIIYDKYDSTNSSKILFRITFSE